MSEENDTLDTDIYKYWKPLKKTITIRIDLDNLQWLQSGGAKGYQKKLNDVLRWARENGCPILEDHE